MFTHSSPIPLLAFLYYSLPPPSMWIQVFTVLQQLCCKITVNQASALRSLILEIPAGQLGRNILHASLLYGNLKT